MSFEETMLMTDSQSDRLQQLTEQYGYDSNIETLDKALNALEATQSDSENVEEHDSTTFKRGYKA